MATSINLAEEEVKPINEDFSELLTCTICLETFKQPKYLPCLHTFCETCISTYIVSSVKEENPEGFKCPVCRCLVYIGDSIENPESWARTLPGNHFVVSLIDRQAMKKSEKFCDACSSKSVSKEAMKWCMVCEEAYCDTCEANHKTFKVSQNHKIVPIENIIEDVSVSNICAFVACDEHPDKTIEIYCKDHSQSCCTVCATVHHRKCEHVVTIDEAVSGVKISTNSQELTKKLIKKSKRIEAIIKNRNQNTTNFKNEIDIVLVEITNMRTKLNDKLDKLENEIREEVNSTRKKYLHRLSEESTELSVLKSTFDHWKNIFEACLSQGSEIQCLVKMEEISRRMPQFENDLYKVVKEIKDISVEFEATNIVFNTKCYGRLHLNEKRPSLPGFKTINFHIGKIIVMFSIDIKGSCISGIFFNDDIIITDYNRNRVVFHDKTGKQKEVLDIPNDPTDISKVNDQTVAVSSYARTICIINVKPLSLVRTLDISVPMWGLCLVEDEFITTYNNSISWLNATTGAKIKELPTSANTRFVTCYKKNEYIYRNEDHSIKFESAAGKGFQYNHSNLSDPYNQEIDEEGNIYVVGYSSNNIHQLTSTGQLIRIIPLSDIDNTITGCPWVMRFKRNTNRFLLTFHASAGPVLVCEIE
ncbi:E3 ubiquitin-protein ligase TRIM23-like [Mytilus californianus]|uniref:E3 ubiquitin-protein ligase TRIM23-like n=1 Tax=Mytilus californianus TaxID=6549 RepID=UPI002246E3A0|nr:E3 ubiquitin-protein ligase TRIM23-like [Mytilus californianus]